MTKPLLFLVTFFIFHTSFSQLTGRVTSASGENLPVVSVYLNDTYIGTTTNDDGIYELNFAKTGEYSVVFQYLGYKTLKKSVTITSFPHTLNAELIEEDISLNEVVINSKENPADIIIRKTIEAREANLEKQNTFSANFYSRGLLKIKNAPEKIFGQDVGDLGGALDSTRSGIIYLSETISKLEYQAPKLLKEKIIASKVSGDDNGFSFNSANSVNFNFYDNTITLGSEIISPIADYAFNYYRYQLVGVFYDDKGNLINKIEITPKRENDKAFSGFVYIVEDDWSLYAVDVSVTGKRAQVIPVDVFTIKQSYTYSETDAIWAKISQVFEFKFGILGITGDGYFTVVYSDYDFSPNFEDDHFTREILSFEDNSNKKDAIYWSTKRPVPLTQPENKDYIKKDSIQLVKESKPYLDSIDGANNAFKIGDIISGYSYQNSQKSYTINVSSPLKGVNFNTVQGFNSFLDVNFMKEYDDFNKYLSIGTKINYGEADDRLRAVAYFRFKFNNINDRFISLSGGIKTEQFNSSAPISPLINSISSLFFEDNYMKLYDKSFAEAKFSQELFNGFSFYSSLAYERRKPLFNHTDYTFINEDRDSYTSNNPRDPFNYTSANFSTHNIVKLNVNARINFAQSFYSRPDGKFNVTNNKYPTLTVGYEKGLGASESNYNFDAFKLGLQQEVVVGNKGVLNYNVKGGFFANADDIAFIDYHHFNGNQTNVNFRGSYLNSYKNLPYYALSTNNNYAEVHAQHNFKGFILNKIPLLNKLNYNMLISTNIAYTESNKPYTEYAIGIDNLGFGKYRFLRIDYVRSYQGSGFISDAVLFGISF
ncbi:carboxypeptidase-like regulatory domain-containing protein [Bizionia gelidisalsuginis]|uniref:Carboxypeptidase-like regulatory domain-containing protein n=1 Tax=Bizionia gelidisalsuginis TaxID=291188 RepID=A0ABY3MED8_9FLAO|nr:DUF5686 and carboxypeptidase regulatory-like domain-containing protein [Bizionia gelidisalsuginis]TYC17967.1 carboxypeptidase-like regulatory domain-containing protein [Bizionia gelidisalsuginis]